MINSFEDNSFNDYFSLFGEQKNFNLNLSVVEKKRKELLQAVHPDRFSGGSSTGTFYGGSSQRSYFGAYKLIT